MPATKYTYSIAGDFPGGAVNTSKLDAEIRNSAIVTAIGRITTSGDIIDIWFKDALSSGDKTVLDGDTTGPAGGLIAAHDNTTSQTITSVALVDNTGVGHPIKFDSEGFMRVSAEIRGGIKYNIFTHTWCDKCTWYQESTGVTDEILGDSGNGLTFNSAHDYWIDLTHGRVTDEDRVVYLASEKWVPVIRVDDVVQTSGYTINYENGDVTFASSQSGKTVKATYWYAGSGKFSAIAPQGKALQLMRVELNFSENIVFNDTMIFTPRGYAAVFAPQFVPPMNPTDLVNLDFPNKYKRASDYILESNASHPLIPPFGGLSGNTIVLVWEYLSRTDLYSSYGMRIDIEMQNNIPHTGELGSATLYSIMRDE